jgi:hypothetical protein
MDATSMLSRVEEVVNDARRITRQAEEKEELSTALAGLKTSHTPSNCSEN